MSEDNTDEGYRYLYYGETTPDERAADIIIKAAGKPVLQSSISDAITEAIDDEREECAKQAETVPNKHMNPTKEFIASAIRKRE